MGKEVLIPLIIGIVAVLVTVIVLLAKNSQKKKKRLEILQIAQDKKREEGLDALILNPKADMVSLQAKSEKAYRSQYFASPDKEGGNSAELRNGPMLRIIELRDLSRREYMVNPAITFTIGSGPENKIAIMDTTVDKKQCEMGLDSGNVRFVYLKNLGDKEKVYMKRDDRVVPVGSDRIRVMSGDMIKMGNVRLTIEIISMV